MTIILNARLKASGKRQTFETDTLEIKRGDKVIVDLESGVDIATVLSTSEEPGEKSLKRVVRIATDEDVKNDKDNTRMEEEGRIFCQEKIKNSCLPMHLVGTRITLDRKKFVFYFTAEKRVDFRELVKDLASKFRTRIELRQIGIRDEAKFLGGIGSCGREVCCKLFLTRFAPISIRMAKRQDIALNPSKLSGLCGRLMCCLSYEHSRDHKTSAKDKPVRTPKVEAPKSKKIAEEIAKKTSEEHPKAVADVQTTEETSAGKQPAQDAETHGEKSETKPETKSVSTKESTGKPDQKKSGKTPRRRRRSRRKKT